MEQEIIAEEPKKVKNGTKRGFDSRNYPPVCSLCGARMSETVVPDLITKELALVWWCPTLECKKLYQDEYNIIHEFDLRNELDADPSKVLPRYGIPKLYYSSTLKGFSKNEVIVNKAKEYLKNPGGNLFFTGSPGTGKTHIAIAILRELIRMNWTKVFFREIPELLLEIRRTYDRKEGECDHESDILERLSKYDFLVLDDLGAEKVSDYSTAILLLIVSRRVNNELPTIVTSNLALAQIDSKVDARLSSRLASGQVWTFTGADYRKRR